MARGGRTHPLVRRFEIAAAIAVGVGLPLAIWLPASLQGRFYAVVALFPIALAVAAGAVYVQKRRDAAAGRSLFRAGEGDLQADPDMVAPWRHLHPDAAASQLYTSQWSL